MNRSKLLESLATDKVSINAAIKAIKMLYPNNGALVLPLPLVRVGYHGYGSTRITLQHITSSIRAKGQYFYCIDEVPVMTEEDWVWLYGDAT